MRSAAPFLLVLLNLPFVVGSAQGSYNAALGRPVTVIYGNPDPNLVSTNYADPAKLVDNIISFSSLFEIRSGNVGTRIIVDLGDTISLAGIRLQAPTIEFRLRGYAIHTSLDGSSWDLWLSDTANPKQTVDTSVVQRTVRWFEVRVTRMDGAPNNMPTVLTEIVLIAPVTRPMISAVSVSAPPADTSQYQTITWTSYLWDASKTISISAETPSGGSIEIATAAPNTGSYRWRTSLLEDGRFVVRVVPDTVGGIGASIPALVRNIVNVSAAVDMGPLNLTPQLPALFSPFSGDTIRFSWSYSVRVPSIKVVDQHAEFSSDSGRTWQLLPIDLDSAARSANIPTSMLPGGGPFCLVRVAITTEQRVQAHAVQRLPFPVITTPWTAAPRWTVGHLPVYGRSSGGGLLAFQRPDRSWLLAGGNRWLVDGEGRSSSRWNQESMLVGPIAAADVNGDGITEIFASRIDGTVAAVADSSSPDAIVIGSPFSSGDYQLVDVNGDGVLENAASWTGGTGVYAADGDHISSYVWSPSTLGSRFLYIQNSAVASLVVTAGSTISAFDSSGIGLQGFPVAVADIFNRQPLPFDIDGDGTAEVLAFGTANVYAVQEHGALAAGFPIRLTKQLVNAAVGDLTGDGRSELVLLLGGSGQYELDCYNAAGARLSGWPRRLPYYDVVLQRIRDPYYGIDDTVAVTLTSIPAPPLLASIDGDAIPEIIVSTSTGWLHIFRSDGVPVTGSPFFIGTRTNQAGVVADIDNDGAVEFVYPLFHGYPERYSLAAVSFGPGSYNERAMPWPMYLANARRDGIAGTAVTVGVERLGVSEIPAAFSLRPNYPNPFNPSTTIEYTLPKDVHTTVRVLNLLGQTMGTLVDEEQPAGVHRLPFTADHLPSGVYIVSVTAGSQRAAQKILLMK